jgi:hypothetical protein
MTYRIAADLLQHLLPIAGKSPETLWQPSASISAMPRQRSCR